jgi:hypothetical protein
MEQKEENISETNARRIQEEFTRVLETTNFCTKRCEVDFANNTFNKKEFDCLSRLIRHLC